MTLARHAAKRSQQRGIPPLICQWLDDFGETQYDGHGGAIRYFSKRSRRELERRFGREPVRRLGEYLDAFKVDSSCDGVTVTMGHRTKRIRRP